MPDPTTFDQALRELESAGAGLRCRDLVSTLQELGFVVRDGKKQGHKVVTHPGIAGFTADAFTCGHGSKPGDQASVRQEGRQAAQALRGRAEKSLGRVIMNIDPHAYNISVRRDIFEGEVLFEARVKELPDLVEYADSYAEAYELAVDAIETAAEAYADQGRAFPQAQVPADEFSGRVTLRLPRSLHRSLAVVADDEGVSLNQHLVNVLSYYSGFAMGRQADACIPWRSVRKPHAGPVGKPNLRVIHNEEFSRSGQACG